MAIHRDETSLTDSASASASLCGIVLVIALRLNRM